MRGFSAGSEASEGLQAEEDPLGWPGHAVTMNQPMLTLRMLQEVVEKRHEQDQISWTAPTARRSLPLPQTAPTIPDGDWES